MANKKQVSVSKLGIMSEVLAEAKRVFDDTDSDGEAFKRLAVDWYRNRQKNSKRASLNRLEETCACMIACMSQMNARLAAIEANLHDALRETVKKDSADQ